MPKTARNKGMLLWICAILIIISLISRGITTISQMCISKISESQFHSNPKYQGYKKTSLVTVEYLKPASYRIDLNNEELTPGFFGSQTLPITLYRKALTTYLYKKNHQKVHVKKVDNIPYPKEMVISDSNNPISSESIDVSLSCNGKRAKGTFRLQGNGFGPEKCYKTYLTIPTEIFEQILTTQDKVSCYIDGSYIGQLSLQGFAEKSRLFKSIDQYFQKYQTNLSKENLDNALRYYQNIHDEKACKHINDLIELTRSFKVFDWGDGNITENPKGTRNAGIILNNCKVLYWDSESSFLYGQTEVQHEPDTKISTYKKFHYFIPDQRTYIEGKSTTRDVIMGRIELNGKHVSPNLATIDQWILEYVGRKAITINDGPSTYIPNFKLSRILTNP